MPYQGRVLSTFATQIQQDNIAVGVGTSGAPSFAFIGDTNNGIFSPSLDNIAITTDGSERLRITNTGNVGIGTDNPTENLHVSGNTNTTIRINNYDDSEATLYFHNTGSTDRKIVTANADMIFYGGSYAADEHVRITSSGNVGIGTTNPETLLDIYGQSENSVQLSLRQWDNALDGPDLRFFSASGTIASPLELSNDYVIGKVNGFAYNGTSFSQYGGFGWIYKTDGLGNRGSAFQIQTVGYGQSLVDRIYIDETGDVGIGTTSPSVKLEVYGDLRIKATDGSHGIELYPDVAALGYQRVISYNRTSSAYEDLSIGVNNFIVTSGASPERLRVSSTGNVGIGTTNPLYKLHVEGDLKIGEDATIWLSTTTGGIEKINSSAGGTLDLYADANIRFIESDANVTRAIIDVNNGELTIGSNLNNSTAEVKVDSAGNSWFNGGNVGIGTTNPLTSLDLYGTLSARGSVGAPTAVFYASGGGNAVQVVSDNSQIDITKLGVSGHSYGGLFIGSGTSSHYHQSLVLIGKRHETAAGVSVGAITAAYRDSLTTATTSVRDATGAEIRFYNTDITNKKTNIQFLQSTNGTSIPSPTFTITDVGNVGIGTANPYTKVEVIGDIGITDVSPQLFFKETGVSNTPVWSWVADGGNFNLRLNNTSPFLFDVTTNADNNAVTSVGLTGGSTNTDDIKVGINTNSPLDRLHVVGPSIRLEDGAGNSKGGKILFGSDTDLISIYRETDTETLYVNQGFSSGASLVLSSVGNVVLSIDSNNNDTDKAFYFRNNGVFSGHNDLFIVNEAGYFIHYSTNTLGTTAGNNLVLGDIYYNNSNGSRIRFKATRLAAGTDWTTASNKILCLTDVTEQGYIEFNPVGGNYSIGLGQGSNEYLRIQNGGNIGIGNTNPAAKLNIGSSYQTNSEYLTIGDLGTSRYYRYIGVPTKTTASGTSQSFPIYVGQFYNGITEVILFVSGSFTEEGSKLIFHKDWGSSSRPYIEYECGSRHEEISWHYELVGNDAYHVWINYTYASGVLSGQANNMRMDITSLSSQGHFTVPSTPTQPTFNDSTKIWNLSLQSELVLSVADDSIGLIYVPRRKGGVATITVYSTYDEFPQPDGSGIIYYDTGASPLAQKWIDVPNLIDVSTSTSTTIGDFTDGRVTYIANTGVLRIANRLSGARSFRVVFS